MFLVHNKMTKYCKRSDFENKIMFQKFPERSFIKMYVRSSFHYTKSPFLFSFVLRHKAFGFQNVMAIKSALICYEKS